MISSFSGFILKLWGLYQIHVTFFFPTSKTQGPSLPTDMRHPQDGFWEVEVKAVRLGNLTLDHCAKGCRGIIDTGASRWGWGKEVGSDRISMVRINGL